MMSYWIVGSKSEMKIIIWGYGFEGVKLYRELAVQSKYQMIGFADNSPYKKGNIVGEYNIFSLNDLVQLRTVTDFAVIIAASQWFIIGEELEKQHIPIEGVYCNGEIFKYDRMCFERLDLLKDITLYAGDICDDIHLSNPDLYGLSLNRADSRHILHDITKKYPLPDNCIYSYQAEDVLEHIEFEKLIDTINEIYRILRPGGLFRISLPDYYSPYLLAISMRDKEGNILFDPTGGGIYGANGVEGGGHIWFPNYYIVQDLLGHTRFKTIEFLCYHTKESRLIKRNIDLLKGYIKRLPKDDGTDKPIYSMVIDCYK